jgi:ribonuclease HI
MKKPIQTFVTTPQLSRSECDTLGTEINKLLMLGAVVSCKPVSNQFVSSTFVVPKPNGSWRFILNLKKLNRFIKAPHFKMEDLRSVSRLVTPNSYMGSIDLKDAYFLVPIHKNSRKFLRFTHQSKLYEFTCLPFGLNVAPYIFTKLMKPVLGIIRKQGILIVCYIDDIIIIANTRDECLSQINFVLSTLKNLGFIINWEKSNLTPSRQCKFLGFIIDSARFRITLPNEKAIKILCSIESLLRKERPRVRQLAQVIGNLISAVPGIKYGWLYTRNLERNKLKSLKCGSYESYVSISQESKTELLWWQHHLLAGYNDIRTDDYKITIYTDASLSGWGAACENSSTHGFWGRLEKQLHINHLELLAVFHGLRAFAKDLQNCNILLRVDNTTALAYINRMGSVHSKVLHELALQIWQWCEIRNIFLVASYIPSSENTRADAESRAQPDILEWELNKGIFQKIARTFGSPNIDLFASMNNAKCKRFCSWKPDPTSEAVDAFTICWSNEHFYAFPPFSLMSRVLQKIYNDQATGIVVAPYWSTQPWFPKFVSMLKCRPMVLQPNQCMLSSPFREFHPLYNHLSLIAGILSGKPSD